MVYIISVLILIVGVVLSIFLGTEFGFDSQIFWLLRLPRTLNGIAVGGGLAVSGVVIQAVYGNPLADPFTTGIASAAALGAVIGTVLHVAGFFGINVFAFGFSLLALFILTVWLKNNYRNATEVLLVGVVGGMFCTALATSILVISDPAAWVSAMSWMLGSLSNLTMVQSCIMLVVILIGCSACWIHWKPLDIMAIDQVVAESVGVDIIKFRKRMFLLVSFLTACCVSIAGVIGFIGLIVPHFLRKIGVTNHLVLIPLSFLTGAGLLLISDVLSRVIIAPSEIPVGVVMSLLGAPIFLVLIKNQRGYL